MAHAVKAVTDRIGPDAVIFPFLRGQPLFDLLHRDVYRRILYDGRGGSRDSMWDRLETHENEMLVPNLPNRFLALVPAGDGEALAVAARDAVAAELGRIAAASWRWIDARHPLKAEWRSRFDLQILAFPQTAWQVLPWDLDPAAWPKPETLYGCAGAYPPNPGLAWSRFYAECDRLLAARRNTRNFDPWMRNAAGSPLDPNLAGTPKDSFSGREEIVGSEDWWEKDFPKTGELVRLFRSDDKLGAVNLMKKVWHEAYLGAPEDQGGIGLRTRRAVTFESVPDVAAAVWLGRFRARAKDALKASVGALDRFLDAAALIQQHADEWSIRVPGEPPTERNIGDTWLREVAPEAFLESEWKRKKEEQPEVRAALRRLYADEEIGLGKPPGYVAVLAFDGDEMGKWVSGDRAPALAGQMSKEARERLGDCVGERRRPLSPSYHLQFSEALSNFSTYLAPLVVERFSGQLIYAGGDDVLCMVPAARALDCAEALRHAFRGQVGLPCVYDVLGNRGGFVRLDDPKGEQPTWPLIVPGPEAECSVGIAIGHMRAPLQALVREARGAEKRAKMMPGKAAFAMTTLKRSGETVEWDAKWQCGALPLYREFIQLTADGKLSGKFAYALHETIAPYECRGGLQPVEGFDAKAVIRLELERVLDRQVVVKDKKEKPVLVKRLREMAHAWLEGLNPKDAVRDFPLLFRTAIFILRGEPE